MAIASAIERGSVILVYDHEGQMLFSKANGSGPHDGLVGYTATTVTVRNGLSITTYAEDGQILFTRGG